MRVVPAEWEPQSAVLLAWPNENTDWADNILEAEQCYSKIIDAISKREKVVLLCHNKEEVRRKLGSVFNRNIVLFEIEYNDTWTRDFGPIAIRNDSEISLLDFQFNGWGKKFNAADDNKVNKKLVKSLFKSVRLEDHNGFILEGGSIESDGKGTILTTTHCLMAPNRSSLRDSHVIEPIVAGMNRNR